MQAVKIIVIKAVSETILRIFIHRVIFSPYCFVIYCILSHRLLNQHKILYRRHTGARCYHSFEICGSSLNLIIATITAVQSYRNRSISDEVIDKGHVLALDNSSVTCRSVCSLNAWIEDVPNPCWRVRTGLKDRAYRCIRVHSHGARAQTAASTPGPAGKKASR